MHTQRNHKTRRARFGLTLVGLVTAGLLAGCEVKVDGEDGILSGGSGQEKPTLTVMAGSEIKDLEPMLNELAEETGVRLDFDYTGTLDGVARLNSGEQPDLVWFSHAKYLELQGSMNGRILSSEKIMLSPVVLGVKESKASEWGWDSGNVTWKDIAEKASSGELQYGMTNPAASNSGMTALIGVTAALSGKGDAITPEDVQGDALKAFFKGQALTAGSSGWLAEAYVKDEARLNGLMNYESVLLSLNRSGQLQEPLTLIYPRDGLITADYPLMLLNEEKRGEYDKLVQALRTEAMQQRIMTETLRRPANPAVALSSDFPDTLLVELPFPNSANTINAILSSYLNETRTPSNTIFVLDVSGSMEGERLEALKSSLNNLSGADTSLGGQFAAFADRERITLIPFSSDIEQNKTLQIRPDTRATDLDAVRRTVSELEAGGETNIYAALGEAYKAATNAPKGFYTSVVLMTDGEQTVGPSLNDFREFYATLPPETRAVKTFTILFGGSDEGEMQAVAELTGGRVFDGRGNLAAAFKEIRGYQ